MKRTPTTPRPEPLFELIFAGKPAPEPPPRFRGDEGAARTTDPPTSKLAAKGLDANPIEDIVVKALARHGKMSTEQIAEVTHLSLVTVSPRMKPLVKKGLVVDTKTKTHNKSGRPAILWDVPRD